MPPFAGTRLRVDTDDSVEDCAPKVCVPAEAEVQELLRGCCDHIQQLNAALRNTSEMALPKMEQAVLLWAKRAEDVAARAHAGRQQAWEVVVPESGIQQDPLPTEAVERKTSEQSAALVPPSLERAESEELLRNSLCFRHSFRRECTGEVEDVYDISGELVGEGTFGQVRKGVERATGVVRAIKSIDLGSLGNWQCSEQLEDEVGIHQELDHPHIVQLFEVFRGDTHLHLAMELCDGGELFALLEERGQLSERTACAYALDILGAVAHLHSRNVVHRDIKPENFLLQQRSHSEDHHPPIKMIDFGTAKRFVPGSRRLMQTRTGTVNYMSPQVLKGSYDEKCDTWSCGVLIYVLMSGIFPFNGEGDRDTVKQIMGAELMFPAPEWDDVSPEARCFLRKLLTKDPSARSSARDATRSTWFQSFDASSTPLPEDLGNRLREFRKSAKTKRVVLVLMARKLQHHSCEKLVAIGRTFAALDRDGEGTLSSQQLLTGMQLRGLIPPADIEEVLRNLDTDGSGKIDYCEFLAATLPPEHYLRHDLLDAAFRLLDLDGDGAISRRDLTFALEEAELADRLLSEADADGDGVISFQEFGQLMQKPSSTEAETATGEAGASNSASTDVDAAARSCPKDGTCSNIAGEALGAKLAERLGLQITERLTARLSAALVVPIMEMQQSSPEMDVERPKPDMRH